MKKKDKITFLLLERDDILEISIDRNNSRALHLLKENTDTPRVNGYNKTPISEEKIMGIIALHVESEGDNNPINFLNRFIESLGKR